MNMGINTYAILRSQRGDGMETIVLDIPWFIHSQKRELIFHYSFQKKIDLIDYVNNTYEANIYAIALVDSLIELFGKQNYWAKDIIFLFSDHGRNGIRHWLQEYTGATSSKYFFF